MLKELEKTEIKNLYSFDIFDTLITRTVANPTAVFLLMKEKLKNTDFSETLKNNFYEIRTEAQLFAIANQHILNKKNDCCFDDIYEVIKNNYALSDEQTELLKKLEIETETENLLPIDENISKVKKLVESGEKVILISDMYHSSDVIRKFLLKCDSVFENIEIFTSGETGKMKTDGTLYKFVKEKYPNSKQVHFGDNKIADIFVPKLNGIKTERYYPEKLKPYEKILLKNNKNAYTQLSVGISRFVRGLSNSKTFDLGCSFAGPMLYGYVDFVLEQALKRGLKHLYFVARDGYVLKEIADIIIEQRNIDIKTHYFYSSRIANRIPDENNIENFIWHFCDELKSLINIEFFAKRLNITLDEMKKFLDIKGNTKKHLSEREIENFAKRVINDKELKDFIIEKNKAKKDLFIRYIKQEIDLSKSDFGFVELNGTGRTQDNIVNLINAEYPIISFFLTNTSEMKQNKKSIKVFYSYSGDLASGNLELFCRTEHGQTIGYEEKNGKIVPALETDKNEKMKKWGYREYLDGIKLYSKYFCKCLDINNIKNNSDIFSSYFDYLKFRQDKEMKNLLKKITYSIYGEEETSKNLLSLVNLGNIIYLFKNFIAFKAHKMMKKMLMLFFIISNAVKLKYDISNIEENYYKYFLK